MEVSIPSPNLEQLEIISRVSRFLFPCIALSLLLSSCSVVAEYPIYIMRTTDPTVPTWEHANAPRYLGGGVRSSDAARRYGSVMMATDDFCILVYETAISSYRILWAGPAGCPCFPILFFNRAPERQGYFSLAILMVARDKNSGLSFDPSKVSLRHRNGTEVSIENISGGRVTTNLEEICLLGFILCSRVEKASHAEEYSRRVIDDYVDPYLLGDWTAFKFTFRKQDKTLTPMRLQLQGLSRDGREYQLPHVNLEESTALVGYVYPLVDATHMTGRASPADCRSVLRPKG